jgi:CRP-like cAMP-binding protein
MDLSGYRIVITQVTNCLCFQAQTVFTCSGKAILMPADTRFCTGFAEGLIPAIIACVHASRDVMEFECTGGFSGCAGQMSYQIEKTGLPYIKTNETVLKKQFAATSKLLLNLPMFKSFDQTSMARLLSHFHLEHIHDLGFKSFKYRDIIISKGQPGTHLYIIVAGKVAVMDDQDNTITYLCNGEVFGEMSLISGKPVGATVKTVAPTTVFRLDIKDFKSILSKFPSLQTYFTALLTRRLANTNAERAMDLTAGMAGTLAEMPPEEVIQTLHAYQKTGVLSLKLTRGEAAIYFRNGDIIHARYDRLTGLDAITGIIASRTGKFNFFPQLPMDAEQMQPLGKFMGILMNALKDMDETI